MHTFPQNGELGGVASGTERYYSFDYANIHFINIYGLYYSDTRLVPMLNWIAEDLDSTGQEWIVAYLHVPPYTMGKYDSDTQPMLRARERIIPVLEDYGVDFVFAGHSHVYERSYLLDGHYGLSTSFDSATMWIDYWRWNWPDRKFLIACMSPRKISGVII